MGREPQSSAERNSPDGAALVDASPLAFADRHQRSILLGSDGTSTRRLGVVKAIDDEGRAEPRVGNPSARPWLRITHLIRLPDVQMALELRKLRAWDEIPHVRHAKMRARDRLPVSIVRGTAPEGRVVGPSELDGRTAATADDPAVERYRVPDGTGEA